MKAITKAIYLKSVRLKLSHKPCTAATIQGRLVGLKLCYSFSSQKNNIQGGVAYSNGRSLQVLFNFKFCHFKTYFVLHLHHIFFN